MDGRAVRRKAMHDRNTFSTIDVADPAALVTGGGECVEQLGVPSDLREC